jgi:1-acyl-sn-glycerol-3-phosphate acyltransferase
MSTARVPTLGPQLPRSGGWLTRALGYALLVVLRWRVRGNLPDLPKFVIIVAPHTSNWDFVAGIAAKFALRLRVRWLGKNTLFHFPLGLLMRALGGIPVDRSASQNVVTHVGEEFERRDRLVLAIAPEGTRARVERWRTGFYYIAQRAGVPIVTVALNWGERSVDIGDVFHPTGNADADIGALQERFAGVRGKRPKS